MLPQSIAIVTSPTGAAIRDILNVLGRRYEGLSVQIYPVRVQGATAGREIADALDARTADADVAGVARSTGSVDDARVANQEIERHRRAPLAAIGHKASTRSPRTHTSSS